MREKARRAQRVGRGSARARATAPERAPPPSRLRSSRARSLASKTAAHLASRLRAVWARRRPLGRVFWRASYVAHAACGAAARPLGADARADAVVDVAHGAFPRDPIRARARVGDGAERPTSPLPPGAFHAREILAQDREIFMPSILSLIHI